MTQKKAPARTGAGKRKSTHKNKTNIEYPKGKYKVEFYPDGVALTAPHHSSKQPLHLEGVGRGDVKGWSKSSRRRMREFMLTHQIRTEFLAYSATLTIPGPLTTGEDGSKLFHRFSVYLSRLGGCAVWRLEVQERGEIHWHAIIGLPEERKPYTSFQDLTLAEVSKLVTWNLSHRPRDHQRLSREGMKSGTWYGCALIQDAWFRSLAALGPVSEDYQGRKIEPVTRDRLPGAQKHSVMVEPLPDAYGAWKRYLFDHTTKVKQSQVAENRGRHWGKIGKKHFQEIEPQTAPLSRAEYARVLRWFNRMVTPYIKCPGAMFNRRKGFAWRRGSAGKYIAFSNPETLRRMVQCATGSIQPLDQRLLSC